MVERDETYQASVVLDQLRGFTDEAKQTMRCCVSAILPRVHFILLFAVVAVLQRKSKSNKTSMNIITSPAQALRDTAIHFQQ
jgi:hypothetical protein